MSPAQLRAELAHAEDTIKLLTERLADSSLVASQEPEIVQSWRDELARIERHASALRKRQGRLT